jgi:F-type H+-transporting ATPase subunit epsilon
VIIKSGAEVLVSARRALSGTVLGQLRDAVEREFLTFDRRDQDMRSTLAKLEGDLIRRLVTVRDER